MKTDARTQAAQWLARLDALPESPRLRAELDAWRAADPSHEAEWLRLSSTWRRLDRLAALKPSGDVVDADLLAPRPAPRSRGFRPLALAASIVLATLALLLLAIPQGNHGRYATNVGERRVVRLADESSIALNTATRLDVQYREGERRVEMREGEALFAVARDPARPFIVVVKDLRIRAVGTAFAVRIKSEGVQVAVTEGVVEVFGDGKGPPERLVAGQVALHEGAQSVVRSVSAAELERKVAWQNGVVVFDGEPLSEAIGEFNRYNRRKIVIADPNIATLRVGGYFRTDDVAGFVSALRASFDLAAVTDDQGTFLSAR